ncbi:MAG: hypothetical protein WBA74_27385 [Cyclobacteriaceae bacterium]
MKKKIIMIATVFVIGLCTSCTDTMEDIKKEEILAVPSTDDEETDDLPIPPPPPVDSSVN